MTPDEKLAAHEKLCAERYATLHFRLDRIESMLNKLIWGIIASFGAVLLIFISNNVKATELPKHMSMKTDVGYVMLSIEPCSDHAIVKMFPYKVVATEYGHDDHEGCWDADGSFVSVWYFEIGKPVVYDKLEFKPHKVEPTL